MNIQIYGAGMAGTFLAHRLKKEDIPFEIYDKMKKISCGKVSCAWGLVTKDLMSIHDFEYEDYILTKPKKIIINGVKGNIRNVVIFDKIKYLNDMWNNLNIEEIKPPSNEDIVVDATGEERALLTKSKNDRLYPTIQTRLIDETLDERAIYVYFDKTLAYAWAFPLGDGQWHVGAGGYTWDHANKLFDKIFNYYFIHRNYKCTCYSKIRIVPPGTLPIHHNNIVGVGEAIGLVSIFGEGNSPAIVSADVLADLLIGVYNGELILNDALKTYERHILNRYDWMIKQYEFLEKWHKNKFKALFDVPNLLKYGMRRTGCDFSSLSILKAILKILL